MQRSPGFMPGHSDESIGLMLFAAMQKPDLPVCRGPVVFHETGDFECHGRCPTVCDDPCSTVSYHPAGVTVACDFGPSDLYGECPRCRRLHRMSGP